MNNGLQPHFTIVLRFADPHHAAPNCVQFFVRDEFHELSAPQWEICPESETLR